jgi:trehalose 6-phosphate synthase/phosphatase
MILKSGKYDKGEAANTLINSKDFDFFLAAGDDKTDEALFKVLNEKGFTIRIGLSPSAAKYNTSGLSLFLKLLKYLVK